MTFTLPYPPSVNHYWRRKGNQYFISEEGQAFRRNVEAVVVSERIPKHTGLVQVAVLAYPPDKRIRDGDNLEKSLYDSLVYCGVIESDSNRHLRFHSMEWCGCFKGGKVEVTVRPYR